MEVKWSLSSMKRRGTSNGEDSLSTVDSVPWFEATSTQQGVRDFHRQLNYCNFFFSVFYYKFLLFFFFFFFNINPTSRYFRVRQCCVSGDYCLFFLLFIDWKFFFLGRFFYFFFFYAVIFFFLRGLRFYKNYNNFFLLL